MERQMQLKLEQEKEKRVAHLQQLGVKRLMQQGLARGWTAWYDMYSEEQRKKRQRADEDGGISQQKKPDEESKGKDSDDSGSENDEPPMADAAIEAALLRAQQGVSLNSEQMTTEDAGSLNTSIIAMATKNGGLNRDLLPETIARAAKGHDHDLDPCAASAKQHAGVTWRWRRVAGRRERPAPGGKTREYV